MNQSHHASKKQHPKSAAPNTASAESMLEVAYRFLVGIEYVRPHIRPKPYKYRAIRILNKALLVLAELVGLLLLLPDSSQSSPILRRTKRTPARVQAAFLPSNSNTSTTPVASAGHPFVLNESNIERTLQTIREKLLDTSAPIVVLDPAHRNQKSSGRKHR